MGPPPFGDGKVTNGVGIYTLPALQWGHRLSAMERPAGARQQQNPAVLQWGHRLSAMERVAGTVYVCPKDATLQWGHRLSAMERQSRWLNGRPQWACFNGATAFRRWKGSRGLFCCYRTRNASMGPPPFGDGKSSGCSTSWGRCRCFNGATAFRRWKAEPNSPGAAPAPCFNGATAFRRWKVGWHMTALIRASEASMGPPPFGDGKLALHHSVCECGKALQWGHRLSAMESCFMR